MFKYKLNNHSKPGLRKNYKLLKFLSFLMYVFFSTPSLQDKNNTPFRIGLQ